MRKLFIPFVLLVMAIAACETEVDLNADYKDITSVFALLDKNDSIQYFKINKAFLGEGNALVYAQEPDSLYYPADKITVTLYALDENEQVVQTISLIRVDTLSKEEGVFSSDNQVVYLTDEPLNSNYTYRLEVEKQNSEEIVSGSTPIVDNVDMIFPAPSRKINPAANFNHVRFFVGKRTRTFQLGVIFNYKDQDTLNNTYTHHSVEYLLSSAEHEVGTREEVDVDYTGIGFMTYIGNAIPDPSPNIIRHAVSLDYKLYLSSADFQTYLDLNGPSDGIVQERPEYTNIENGVGLMASRNIDIGVGNLEFLPAFYDSLLCNNRTEHLMFAKYSTTAGGNGTDTILRCPF